MPSRLAVAVAAALWAAGSAYGHDWYPTKCCREVDCAPMQAGSVLFTAGGWLVLESRETIPADDARIRLSPDRRFHRCRLAFWDTHSGTRCLFVPAPDG